MPSPAELLPQVYAELRRLAAAKLAGENPGHTLDATALVHEMFLKLGGERSFATQNDYLRAAAQAMRRILVDHARAREAAKRGGGRRVNFDPQQLVAPAGDDDIEALDDALSQLAAEHPKVAEIVQLKHFGGLTLAQCADILEISPRTADSWWAYARSWLAVELAKT
jgi:RNA polymerase sigma factor (TIGR02999 family)